MALQLSDEEIAQLRDLLKHAPQIKEEAEYRAARRLVVKSWKQAVIATAGFLAAAALIYDYGGRALASLLGK